MVIHGTELVAVQEHPLPDVTLTLRNAEAAVKDTLVVESTMLQCGAACVTEKTRPPIVSDPVRVLFVVLAATSY
jgi:hypothetical protein